MDKLVLWNRVLLITSNTQHLLCAGQYSNCFTYNSFIPHNNLRGKYYYHREVNQLAQSNIAIQQQNWKQSRKTNSGNSLKSSGQDSVLLLMRVWVQSLIRELRSHKPLSTPSPKKKKKKKKKRKEIHTYKEIQFKTEEELQIRG